MLAPLWFVEMALILASAPWFLLLAAVTAAAILGRRSGPDPAGEPDPAASRFLIVIPAHDEAGAVGVTVASCLAVDYPADRFQVVVIADNCSDSTAAEAEAAGALVVIRSTADRRSKGYALEDFFAGVEADPRARPRDAFVLVDADTSVDADLLRAFDRSLRRGDDFVQGYYSVRNADASWRTRLMTFAFGLTNGAWLLGQDRLGLSVGLKGNGMCFRAEALRRFPWRAYGLVEDMEYAWALRAAGERVRFQPAARVFGEMVSRGGPGAVSQRQRWESGRRALRASVPPLLRASRLSPWRQLVYRVDLGFPPLSRLAARLVPATLGAAGGLALGGLGRWWAVPVGLVAAGWLALLAYLFAPFVTLGLPIRYLWSLAHLPSFLAWKVATSVARPVEGWVRTPREAPETRAAAGPRR